MPNALNILLFVKYRVIFYRKYNMASINPKTFSPTKNIGKYFISLTVRTLTIINESTDFDPAYI